MKSIIGTWRLYSLEFEDVRGEVVFPFGKKAKGLLIYQKDGWMSGMMSGENRPDITSPALFGISEQDRAAIAKNFIAYAGTYKVEDSKVIHSIEVSFVPNLMKRKTHISLYSFDADRLIVTPETISNNKRKVDITIIWEPVSSSRF